MTGHVQLKLINRLANKTMSSSFFHLVFKFFFFFNLFFFIGDGKFCCVFMLERRCLHSQNRPLFFFIFMSSLSPILAQSLPGDTAGDGSHNS